MPPPKKEPLHYLWENEGHPDDVITITFSAPRALLIHVANHARANQRNLSNFITAILTRLPPNP